MDIGGFTEIKFGWNNRWPEVSVI